MKAILIRHCEGPKAPKQSQKRDCFVGIDVNKSLLAMTVVLVIFFTVRAAYPQAEQIAEQPEKVEMSPQEEIAALKMQLANSKRIFANENRELLGKIDSLNKAVDKLKKANAELEEANKKLIENPSELSLKLIASEQAAKEAREKARSALDDLNLEIARLKTDASKAKTEYKDVTREKAIASKEAQDLASKNRALEAKLLSVNKELAVAKSENRRLKSELVPVRKLKAKLAISYQQLGTAYAQLNKYDLAIDAYNKSLKYNFNNPVVHCNLGLLYEHSHARALRAIYHLNKYLELKPDAVDRNEIMFIIKRLSEVEDGDIVFFN